MVRLVQRDAPAIMEWCICANLTHPTNDSLGGDRENWLEDREDRGY